MNTSYDIYELNNAVLDASKTIKDMRNDFTVDSKDAVVDLVTNADLKSEEILIEAITKYFQRMELFRKNQMKSSLLMADHG